MLKKLSKYNKLWVAILGVILTGVNVQYGDNTIVQLVIAVATAAGVYAVPNRAR